MNPCKDISLFRAFTDYDNCTIFVLFNTIDEADY